MTCIEETIVEQIPVSGATNLYTATYYVVNSDYRVYECLQNGTDPDNPNGRPSLDEPTFTDLEPRSAGSSGDDNYIWKYLHTIKPSDIVKFDSTDFMPVPADWETSSDNASVRDNAVDGSIKIVTVTNRGVSIGLLVEQNIGMFLLKEMVLVQNVRLQHQ